MQNVVTMKFATVAIFSLFATVAACDSGKSSSPDAMVTPTADAPAAAVDAPTSSGAPKYMTACTIGGPACEAPYMCFNFNNKGPHCSKACTVPADCPAPSTGCSNMGVCKVP